MTYADQIEIDHIQRIGPKTERERILLEALKEATALETRVEELENELQDKNDQSGALEDKIDEKEEEIDRLTDEIDELKEENENLYKGIEELNK